MSTRHWIATSAVLALLGGCATQPKAPSQTGRLRLSVDGQSIAAILSSAETTHISAHIPAKFQGQVLSAEALGTVVYRHAALVAAAAGRIGREQQWAGNTRPAGWLTERGDKRLRMLFLVHGRANTVRIAAIAMAQDATMTEVRIKKLTPPRPLSKSESALWRARQLAYSAKITPCTKRYNPVVIPVRAKNASELYVYLLPESQDPQRVFLGGYYRVAINDLGNRIVATHAFTRACLALRRGPGDVAASVTERKSNTPTAPQVYASLRYGLPIYVATVTNGLRWKVVKGRIELLNSGRNNAAGR